MLLVESLNRLAMLGLLLFLFRKVDILLDYEFIFLFFGAILLNISEVRVCKLSLSQKFRDFDIFNRLERLWTFKFSSEALLINYRLAKSVFTIVMIRHRHLNLLMNLF